MTVLLYIWLYKKNVYQRKISHLFKVTQLAVSHFNEIDKNGSFPEKNWQ
jgi:predicted XRE-type DNA-binding protein